MIGRRKIFATLGAAFVVSVAARSGKAMANTAPSPQVSTTHNSKRNYFFAFAGNESVTGAANVGIGEIALSKLSTGFNNVAVGDQAMRVHSDGINNVAVGALAMADSEACIDCTAVGTGALQSATLGVGTTAMGRLSCNSLLNAGNNTAYGDSTLRFLEVGERNVAAGYRAAETLREGVGNVFVGGQAAISIESGNDNVFLGYLSGWADKQAKKVNNSIAIGAKTYTTKSDQIVIGTSQTKEIVLGGVRITPKQLKRLIALLEEN